MASDIEDRIRLEDRLREVLGLPEASTLLSYLPRDDPADLATKQDLAALERRTDERFDRVDHQITDLRSDVQRLWSGQDQLRASHDQLRAGQDQLRAGQDQLRADVRADLAELRADVRGDLLEAVARANRTTAIAFAGTVVASSTLALAILRLGG